MSTIDVRFTSFEGFSPMVQSGPYRAEDYWALPEGAPVELLRGELVMSPAPKSSHQIVVGELYVRLHAAALRSGGLCLVAPADVILSEDTILQPDVLYVAKDRRGIIGDRVNGPPDLIIEVLSAGAERRDRVQKLNLYAQYGVPEFWIVDPRAQSIDFLLLDQGRYVVNQAAAGRYQSPRLPELEIGLAGFWQDVAERTP